MQTAGHATRIVPTTASVAAASVATPAWAIARVLLLSPVVDALVVVQTVEGAEDLVAQVADRIVQWLQVLLLLVSLQRELGAQQFAAHIAPVTGGEGQWQGQSARPTVIRHDMGTARGIPVGPRLLVVLAHNTAENADAVRVAPLETVPVPVPVTAAALVEMAMMMLMLLLLLLLLVIVEVVHGVVVVEWVVMPRR